MIIYGTNSKLIKQAPLENQKCDNCNESQLNLLISSSYTHIFWIPIFPFKKSAIIHCGHCQKSTEEKQMDSEVKQKIKTLKSAVATPKYLFSGLLLIGVLIVFLTYNGSVRTSKMEGYFNDPQKGDVYILKDETEVTDYKYYFWKIVDVTDDSLYVSTSSFSYNGKTTKLEPADGFYDVFYAIDRDLVHEMRSKKEILDVIREYDESSGFNRTISYPLDSAASY